MKTVKEIYQESLDQINEAGTINEITSSIQEVTTALHNNELARWTPDELSRAIGKIAVLRVNLGACLADAVAYYDISYMHRKLRYASEWQPTKNALNQELKRATVQDIDSDIMGTLAEEYQEEIKNKHYAEKLRLIYDATETLITALQSRLNVLKQERAETRYSGSY